MEGRSHEKRHLLVQSAARLFREKGYAHTTVRDLGKAVGLLSGSLFYHFDTKNDILCTVMAESIAVTFERIRHRLKQVTTPRDKLLALIMSDLEGLHLETKDGYYVLVHEWRNLSEENQKKILALRGEYEGFWMDVLHECDEAGLLSMDPVILRRLLNGAISWTSHWFRLDGRISLEELADHVLLLAIKGDKDDQPIQATELDPSE
jgi:AcrR family transcriptional regulator